MNPMSLYLILAPSRTSNSELTVENMSEKNVNIFYNPKLKCCKTNYFNFLVDLYIEYM
jgi:hypothetical protein